MKSKLKDTWPEPHSVPLSSVTLTTTNGTEERGSCKAQFKQNDVKIGQPQIPWCKETQPSPWQCNSVSQHLLDKTCLGFQTGSGIPAGLEISKTSIATSHIRHQPMVKWWFWTCSGCVFFSLWGIICGHVLFLQTRFQPPRELPSRNKTWWIQNSMRISCPFAGRSIQQLQRLV